MNGPQIRRAVCQIHHVRQWRTQPEDIFKHSLLWMEVSISGDPMIRFCCADSVCGADMRHGRVNGRYLPSVHPLTFGRMKQRMIGFPYGCASSGYIVATLYARIPAEALCNLAVSTRERLSRAVDGRTTRRSG